jgi:uncharacterized protein YpmS
VQSQLIATFRPTVNDGRLQFELVNASVGGIPVPAPVLSGVEATLNKSLGTVLNNLPNNYTLEQIVMGEGTMTVVARQQP